MCERDVCLNKILEESPRNNRGHECHNGASQVSTAEEVVAALRLSSRGLGGVKYECRCDERLKAKAEGSTRLLYTRLLET